MSGQVIHLSAEAHAELERLRAQRRESGSAIVEQLIRAEIARVAEGDTDPHAQRRAQMLLATRMPEVIWPDEETPARAPPQKQPLPDDPTSGGKYPAHACSGNGGWVHSRVGYEYEGRARIAVCADCGARNDGSGWRMS